MCVCLFWKHNLQIKLFLKKEKDNVPITMVIKPHFFKFTFESGLIL